MAKKSKKVELSEVVEPSTPSETNSVLEVVNEQPVVSEPKETVVDEPVAALEVAPAEPTAVESVEPTQVEEETVESAPATVEEVKTEPVVIESSPVTAHSNAPIRKVGKVTVTQSFLNSNTMFFPWLHRQGYAIISRSYDEKRDQMTFVLEGGELLGVIGDAIPEYNIHVTGSRLSITKK